MKAAKSLLDRSLTCTNQGTSCRTRLERNVTRHTQTDQIPHKMIDNVTTSCYKKVGERKMIMGARYVVQPCPHTEAKG